MAFKIGFGATNKKKPAASSKPLFGEDEDDADKGGDHKSAEVGSLPLNKKLGHSKTSQDASLADRPALKARPKAGLPVSQYGDLSKERENLKTVEKALETDPTIYDYDAAYDAIHAKDAERKAQRKKEADERKSKYMENFISAAKTREQDLARAKDKQLQREREAEGAMYADKEKFVTEAYKKQQEEIRIAEEEEKKRQAAEEEKRKASGMQGFYRGIMDEQEKRHQEAMKAAEEAARTGKIAKVEDDNEKTDAQIAEEMRARGKDVLLNDEGQIIDKRETLSAGLNVIKKPKPATGPKAEGRLDIQPTAQFRGIGNQKAMRERQTKMMEEQLAAVAKRAADDDAEEQRKLEHASKTRKTTEEIGSAKERYLARKRAAEEAKKNKDVGT